MYVDKALKQTLLVESKYFPGKMLSNRHVHRETALFLRWKYTVRTGLCPSGNVIFRHLSLTGTTYTAIPKGKGIRFMIPIWTICHLADIIRLGEGDGQYTPCFVYHNRRVWDALYPGSWDRVVTPLLSRISMDEVRKPLSTTKPTDPDNDPDIPAYARDRVF